MSIRPWLFALLAAAAPTPSPVFDGSAASGQIGCRFELGFKTLHDLIPDIVGACWENEHPIGVRGDAVQATSHGLLVWRKAHNWTAFTDGATTWISGPYGLEKRHNAGPLFPWEAADADMAAPVAADGRSVIEALVTRVIDGSSLDAYVFGKRTALGYLGAETLPANQPCGQEALARNRQLAGTRVLLEEDAAYRFDGLGRRLYYAYTSDGLSIDEALVREGLARAVRTDAGHGADLAAVEAEAAAAGRGCLWGSSTNS